MPEPPELVSTPECQAQVAEIVNDFEDGSLSVEDAASRIEIVTGRPVDPNVLRGYWGSESLEELARRLCTEPIQEWADIPEEQALSLIQQILDDPVDDALFARNVAALEKRFRKPSGTLSDLIFHNDNTDPAWILEQIRVDTVKYL
ncbi:MAG: hypothetical protein AAF089_14660 [Bacteroidota bacterium]